jgi:DNA polymerase I-like protein with 3'-5' exonuclease and polymerase domains
MPTYSPFAVLKNYSFRPTVVSDLKKAAQESTTKDIINTEREIYIEPTYPEVLQFFKECKEENSEDNPLSFDIETASGEITCIGFAPSPERSMVVPFRDTTQKSQTFYNYTTELAVWSAIKELLEDKTIVKVAQNQTYDVSWLNHKYGIEVAGTVHDTMHAQHSLQPEMEKGLGFLGSIYTNEGAWKNLTSFSKSTKAEE